MDNTLINPSGPSGYRMAKEMCEYKGMDFPSMGLIEENHYNWWDNPMSLNTELFDFKPFPGLMRLWRDGRAHKTAVITHRTQGMKNAVESVLSEIGLVYDYLEFGGRTVRNKTSILSQILQLERPVDKLRIFEDSLKELIEYEEFIRRVNAHDLKSVEYYMINTKEIYEVSPAMLSNAVVKKVDVLHESPE